jgi:hypothetical protein
MDEVASRLGSMSLAVLHCMSLMCLFLEWMNYTFRAAEAWW